MKATGANAKRAIGSHEKYREQERILALNGGLHPPAPEPDPEPLTDDAVDRYLQRAMFDVDQAIRRRARTEA